MSTLATLRALHATIGSALNDIERVYSQDGLDFPSLDRPVYYDASAANDSSKPKVDAAESLRSDPVISKAVNFVVAACGQLSATVYDPFYSLTQAMSSVSVASVFEARAHSSGCD